MKSKELIKLLQEADPEGECHVRLSGLGTPLFVDKIAGYWDGPYEYADGDKWVISTQGSKIDIRAMDHEDFIHNNKGDYSNIKLDLTYVEDYTDEYIESFKRIGDNYLRIMEELKGMEDGSSFEDRINRNFDKVIDDNFDVLLGV